LEREFPKGFVAPRKQTSGSGVGTSLISERCQRQAKRRFNGDGYPPAAPRLEGIVLGRIVLGLSAHHGAGIRAVDDFITLLRSVERGDFAEQLPAARASVGTLIGNALELLAGGQRAAALDALRRGFGGYLDALFRSRKELVPYGSDDSPRTLLVQAGGLRVFDGLTWRLLRHARPYLLEGIVPENLDPVAFAVAARLVLRLHVPLLLTKRSAG
jgi:hypothetical protein